MGLLFLNAFLCRVYVCKLNAVIALSVKFVSGRGIKTLHGNDCNLPHNLVPVRMKRIRFLGNQIWDRLNEAG